MKTDGESTEDFETINIEKYDNHPINEEIQVEEDNPETKDNVRENSNSSVNESGDKNREAG